MLARRRVEEAGLSDRVEVIETDYRDLSGPYDRLVSVEMIEAVGWKDFPTYFRQCSSLLKPGGAMLLQAIVIDDDAYELKKASRIFISHFGFRSGRNGDIQMLFAKPAFTPAPAASGQAADLPLTQPSGNAPAGTSPA